jgi:phospholipid transport system transporter-binding protein
MIPLSVTTKSDNLVLLSGDLTFATITQKTVHLINFKKMNPRIVIDLAQIKSSDSAGLALLIEWLKISRIEQKQLRFNSIPAQLLTLAKLSGFEIELYFFEADLNN